jgi:hypothetical protein
VCLGAVGPVAVACCQFCFQEANMDLRTHRHIGDVIRITESRYGVKGVRNVMDVHETLC